MVANPSEGDFYMYLVYKNEIATGIPVQNLLSPLYAHGQTIFIIYNLLWFYGPYLLCDGAPEYSEAAVHSLTWIDPR